jgi:hypothetical protein
MSSSGIFRALVQRAAALDGLVVSVLATGPTVAGSGPAEDGGFLWAIKCSQKYNALSQNT